MAALPEPEIVFGWVVRTPPWLAEVDLPASTVMTGVGLRAAVGAGRVRAVHARLSAMPGLLAGRLRPDVAVVGAVADGSRWRAIGPVGWSTAAARSARAVVVERWERWPPGATGPPDTPLLEGPVVEVVERTEPPDPPQVAPVGTAEARIGALAAGLVPEGATVQWGPGSLGAAFLAALEVPVSVRSGLVTDDLVELERRGLLRGVAEAAYLWGGPGLAGLLDAGRIRLRPVEVTHDLTRLSRREAFVAVNTALQVGLDGSVNVEVAGGRVVSGPGGHPDFCLGASRSPGGLSIVVARSEVGDRSSIVERPTVVSTPSSDVDVVVTEHGVADLRGLDRPARRAALLGVAHPAHRAALAAAPSG